MLFAETYFFSGSADFTAFSISALILSMPGFVSFVTFWRIFSTAPFFFIECRTKTVTGARSRRIHASASFARLWRARGITTADVLGPAGFFSSTDLPGGTDAIRKSLPSTGGPPPVMGAAADGAGVGVRGGGIGAGGGAGGSIDADFLGTRGIGW